MDVSGYLEWGPALETGIQAIDEQHKILVGMCNQANRKLHDHFDKKFVEETVRDLMSYALYHFDQEEELMLSHAYMARSPELAARHVAEHRGFSEKVATIQRNLSKGELIKREALMEFLNNWLVNHILNTDMEFVRFVNKSAAAT